MKRFLIFLCSVLVLSGCASGGRVSLEDGDKMMQTDQWTKMDSEQAAKKNHAGFDNPRRIYRLPAGIGT